MQRLFDALSDLVTRVDLCRTEGSDSVYLPVDKAIVKLVLDTRDYLEMFPNCQDEIETLSRLYARMHRAMTHHAALIVNLSRSEILSLVFVLRLLLDDQCQGN